MAKTDIRSGQVRDGEIRRANLNTADSGDAVVTRLVAGSGISLSETGVDTGTGDVTITATGSGGVIANDVWQQWRNFDDDADINVLKVSANDDTVLNAISGKIIKLQIAEVTQWSVDASGNLVGHNTASHIKQDTTDGSDDGYITICGGGAASSLRGARIEVYGNEEGSQGGNVLVKTGESTSAYINFETGSGGGITSRWRITGTALEPRANSTYDIGTSSLKVQSVYADTIDAGSGSLFFRAGSAAAWRITGSLDYEPEVDNSRDIGSALLRVRTLYTLGIQASGGPLTIGTSGTIIFQSGGATQWSMTGSGHLTPASDFGENIGSSSFHVNTIWTSQLQRNDGTANGIVLNDVSSTGRIRFQINGLSYWSLLSTGQITVNSRTTDTAIMQFWDQNNTSYASRIQVLYCSRTANTAYTFVETRSNAGGDIEHKLKGNGDGTCDGSWTGGGADYAEYFESTDGTALQIGQSVVLIGEKVRLYDDQTDALSDIIGVVRPKEGGSAAIGNHPLKWHHKYIRDDYGAYVLAAHSETGLMERQLNPSYDDQQEYIDRRDRDEWNVVGLLGQVPVDANADVHPDWVYMKDISANTKLYFIK